MRFLILTTLFCLLAMGQVMAKPIHQHYMSIRAIGMGNAFNGMTDDQSVMFYNPAGLPLMKEGHININLMRAGLSTGDSSFIDLYNDISDAEGAATDKETKMAQVIEKQYGKNYYARITGPNFMWSRKGWGIAFIPLDLTLNLGIHQQVGPSLNVEAYQDTTLAYGRGWRFKKVKGLSIGATAKLIYRMYGQIITPAIELAQGGDILDKDKLKEGATLDFDIGTMYRLPVNWKYVRPSFSFVGRNVFDYGFVKNMNIIGDATGKPPKLERRFDLGTKLSFKSLFGFKPCILAEVKDMGHSEWTMMKGLHMGGELKWKGWYLLNGSVRAGMNQGYATFGASFKILIINLDYATYGEEIGTKNSKKENRVHMAKLSLDF